MAMLLPTHLCLAAAAHHLLQVCAHVWCTTTRRQLLEYALHHSTQSRLVFGSHQTCVDG
jgi:hypothetical protein